MNNPSPGNPSQEMVDRVINVIAKQKEVPPDSITLTSKFEDLNVDSLDATEILFELEDELDIDIPNDQAREMRDVGQVVEGLEKLLASKGKAPTDSPATPSDTSEA